MRFLILWLPFVGSGCCCIPEPSWLSKQLLPADGAAVVFSSLDGFEDAVERCNNAGANMYDVNVEVQISMSAYYSANDTGRIASDMLSDAGVYAPADDMHVKVVGRTYEIGRSGIGVLSGPQYRVVGGTVKCGFGVNTKKKEEEK